MVLDPDFVMEQVAKAPREFDVQARNREHDIHLGGEHMVFASVYGPPFVREGDTRREATIEDFRRFAMLSQHFPQLDSRRRHDLRAERHAARLPPPGHGVRAADADRQAVHGLGHLRPERRGHDPHERDPVRRARGDRGDPVSISLINVNSPLRYDDRMLAAMMEYVRAGQPVVITPFLLMGAMSPVSIPASLAQQLAEALAGIALAQLVRPGTPVLFGSFLSNTDMQSGSPSFGTPESALGLLCTGQLARHYGLPFRSGGGLTASQTVDAQASYEAMMTMLPTFLAGVNWVMHSAGLARVGAGLLLREVHRRHRDPADAKEEFTPLEIDEASLAFGAHEEVGPGGHFLGAVHTLERFRDCFYRPLLSSTENYERWERNGGNDATARAGQLWREALDEYEQPPLDDAVRDELQEYVVRRRAELGD